MNPPEQLQERKTVASSSGNSGIPKEVIDRLLDDIEFDLVMAKFDTGLRALLEDDTCPFCTVPDLTSKPKRKDNWSWPMQLPPTM